MQFTRNRCHCCNPVIFLIELGRAPISMASVASMAAHRAMHEEVHHAAKKQEANKEDRISGNVSAVFIE
mgnify:CR=1 FL=1